MVNSVEVEQVRVSFESVLTTAALVVPTTIVTLTTLRCTVGQAYRN